MTSLNGAGIHISMLKLSDHEDMFVECLDAETKAPCWPGCSYSIPSTTLRTLPKDAKKRMAEKTGISLNIREQRLMKLCLKNACEAITEIEEYLNQLDRGCGDGDCGSTLKRLADSKILNANYMRIPLSLIY